MSFETWCDEFYPVPADAVGKEDALRHSLVKWYGLRKENLARHEMVAGSRGRIYSPPDFIAPGIGRRLRVDSTSCALCHHHLGASTSTLCVGCPLYESRGGTSCDGRTEGEYETGAPPPYDAWVTHLDPEPMILALEKAVHYVKPAPKSPGANPMTNPTDRLRHHGTGAIERGEAKPVVGLNLNVNRSTIYQVQVTVPDHLHEKYGHQTFFLRRIEDIATNSQAVTRDSHYTDYVLTAESWNKDWTEAWLREIVKFMLELQGMLDADQT